MSPTRKIGVCSATDTLFVHSVGGLMALANHHQLVMVSGWLDDDELEDGLFPVSGTCSTHDAIVIISLSGAVLHFR